MLNFMLHTLRRALLPAASASVRRKRCRIVVGYARLDLLLGTIPE